MTPRDHARPTPAPLPRVLYVAPEFDYGRPEQGPSYEHANFFDAWRRAGAQLIHFDPVRLLPLMGREAMNRRLWEVARAADADLLFCVLFTDELDPAVLARIGAETRTVTLNWFCDDHWRFEGFSSRWCHAFRHVATTARSAPAKYAAIGHRGAIKTQWAANAYAYRPWPAGAPLPPSLGGVPGADLAAAATFVGMAHATRPRTVAALAQAGLPVTCFGADWPKHGHRPRLDLDAMIACFARSAVSINLANHSSQRWPRTDEDRAAALVANQIKGRVFEVPACGGCLLTEAAEDLDACFVPGREVEVFASMDELTGKLRALLADPDRRAALGAAGRARVLAEHTWNHRFNHLLAAVGLPHRVRMLDEPGPAGSPGDVERIELPTLAPALP